MSGRVNVRGQAASQRNMDAVSEDTDEQGSPDEALFTFVYNDQRVFVRKPLTYEEAVSSARLEFPALRGLAVTFKTMDHPSCHGHWQRISKGAWKLVSPGVDSVVIEGQAEPNVEGFRDNVNLHDTHDRNIHERPPSYSSRGGPGSVADTVSVSDLRILQLPTVPTPPSTPPSVSPEPFQLPEAPIPYRAPHARAPPVLRRPIPLPTSSPDTSSTPLSNPPSRRRPGPPTQTPRSIDSVTRQLTASTAGLSLGNQAPTPSVPSPSRTAPAAQTISPSRANTQSSPTTSRRPSNPSTSSSSAQRSHSSQRSLGTSIPTPPTSTPSVPQRQQNSHNSAPSTRTRVNHSSAASSPNPTTSGTTRSTRQQPQSHSRSRSTTTGTNNGHAAESVVADTVASRQRRVQRTNDNRANTDTDDPRRRALWL